MTNNLYVLYNNLSLRYGDVRVFATDGYAVAHIQPDIPEKMLPEFELCRVGSIDIETGVVQPCAPVRIAWRDVPEKLPVGPSVSVDNLN